MKQMATNNIQFQYNVSATIKDLQTHIEPLATTVNQLLQQHKKTNPPHTNNIQFQQNVSGTIQELHTQIGQLAPSRIICEI